MCIVKQEKMMWGAELVVLHVEACSRLETSNHAFRQKAPETENRNR